MILESDNIACLRCANPSHMSILRRGGVQEGRANVGVGSICGKVSTKGVSIIVIVVSWVDERSLGANSDAVPLFLQSLMARLWDSVAAAGCDCGP